MKYKGNPQRNCIRDKEYISSYKHVYRLRNTKTQELFYSAKVKKTTDGKTFSTCDYFDNEREAAIAVDNMLIRAGREPVNILIRKQ